MSSDHITRDCFNTSEVMDKLILDVLQKPDLVRILREACYLIDRQRHDVRFVRKQLQESVSFLINREVNS